MWSEKTELLTEVRSSKSYVALTDLQVVMVTRLHENPSSHGNIQVFIHIRQEHQ